MPRDGASFFKEDRVRGLYEFEIKKVSYHYCAGACRRLDLLLPYIKYVFYDAQISTMGITNTQSGLMLTMYTIGNMILYIPGGIIADKVSPKKALVISLQYNGAGIYLCVFYEFCSSHGDLAGTVLQYCICILVLSDESNPYYRNRRRTGIYVRTVLCM